MESLTFMDTSEEHPLKALLPIYVTDAGISIEVRQEQLLNALYPMEVTESGIVMAVNSEQP